MIDVSFLIQKMLERLTADPFHYRSIGAGDTGDARENYISIRGFGVEAESPDTIGGQATGELRTYKKGDMTIEIAETIAPDATDNATQGWGKADDRKRAIAAALSDSLADAAAHGDIDSYYIGELVVTPDTGDQNQNRFVFMFDLIYYLQR